MIVNLGIYFDTYLADNLSRDPIAAARRRSDTALVSDGDLADALAMGELDGEDEPGEVNVPATIKTLGKVKICKKFDLQRRYAAIGRRYYFACRAEFGSTMKSVLCHDGSGFKQERVFSVLGSYTGRAQDEFLVAIPPPQDLLVEVVGKSLPST